MTKIELKYLIWNEFNTEHVKTHGLTKSDVDKAIKNIIAHKFGYRGRIILICKLNERLISIILDKKWNKKYYVVTARSADRKERKLPK